MPTVLRERGFSVRIYLNDHPPAHVHVVSANGQAKINLGSKNDPPSLLKIWGMSDQEALKALELIKAHQKDLLQQWKQIYE